MLGKVLDEITYAFPNFNSATVEVWEWISNFIPHFIMDVISYLFMLGLKLIHYSKRGPSCHMQPNRETDDFSARFFFSLIYDS